VGTETARIVSEASLLLDDSQEYARRARVHNPYGDGHASARIGDAIHSFFEARQR
jgi:UDP-N-acetylglucosamine 2-epimerase (non-hydrolysing)